ncbi:hypothetical protein F2P56_033465 [Juglans regia]|uniref:Reverse transcriptase domain-containing protein n=2 Tax=Juglans regia TaxID=51240 RepID=A0A833X830_JUGRE|nr:uncharacterized protein LOC109001610 [Juglans regia]KAF5447955.1 hypothetical protein F2P56_033465 [Juglans regia]
MERKEVLRSTGKSYEGNKLGKIGAQKQMRVKDLMREVLRPTGVQVFSLVKSKFPSLILLIETKCSRHKVELVRKKLGMSYSFVVDSKGASGGLAFLWNDFVHVDLLSYSQSHISVIIDKWGDNKGWICTGFYGNPMTSKRYQSWELLPVLDPSSSNPWLCLGDFNEILHYGEKLGGGPRPLAQMEGFRTAFNGMWEGSQFTKERLDRACANSAWIDKFGGFLVTTATTSSFDHRPLVVSLDPEGQKLIRGERPFRYEASWALREDCHKVVKEAWKRPEMVSNKLELATEGLTRCKESLRTWSKTLGGSTNKHVHMKIKQLSALQQADKGDLQGSIQAVKKEIDQLLKEDDIHWKQRAKQRWLQEGDRNTKFFHQCASQRRKKNTIKTVADKAGSIAKTPEEVGAKFQHFFQNLFTTSNPEGISKSLSQLERKVTEEMNEALLRKYTKQEVKMAVFSMNPLSSPGPDGFPPAFYQNHWSLVEDEALHTMNNRMIGKEGYMALKLDMSKAYDKIEWKFLREVMIKMGFAQEWIQLVMNCVESVSYSILLNGSPQDLFKPTRGIRQGDPLSPYLFILCAEVLSSLLNHAEFSRAISGVPIARGMIHINHLLFADDSLLFCKANSLEWSRLLFVLSLYENASGQHLNKEKTSIHFSRNTSHENKELILRIAGVRSTQPYEKYLGLPALMGRSRNQSFNIILDRIRHKLSSNKVKLLSQAGKEIFIKSVIQSMPTYSMAVFKLPWALLKEINKLLRNYWWGQIEKERKIH